MIDKHFRYSALVCALLASLAMGARAQEAAPAAAAAPAAEAPKKIGLMISMQPLTSKDDARRYAARWIQAAGLTSMRLGKVRALDGLYVADLVDAGNPKQFVNQLMMRKRDGYMVLVYPSSVAGTKGAAPDGKDPMAGMAGMEGMSGSGKVYGGIGAVGGPTPSLAPRNFLIGTTQEATTAAKLWLFQNGLHAMKVGSVKEQGGIYVGKVLDKASNAERNQFVVRRADGLIAMVNPVALTPGKAGPYAHSGAHN